MAFSTYQIRTDTPNNSDAAWGESTPRGKAEFERLRTLLKEADEVMAV